MLSPEPTVAAAEETSRAERPSGRSRFGRRLHCPGLVCARVDDPATERMVREFHAEIYAERGFIDSLPEGGVIDDAYAAISTYFAAHDRAGTLVGTARLIPMSALGLPVPRLFTLDPGWERTLAGLDSRRVAELASLATRASSSDQWFALPAAILRTVFHESMASGVSHIVAAVEPSLLRIVSDFLRIPVHVIGAETPYYGVTRLPILLDIVEATAHVRRHGPAEVLDYFTDGMVLDLSRFEEDHGNRRLPA